MAHWIIEDKGFALRFYACSNCHNVVSNLSGLGDDPSSWDRCRICGADLDEESVYTDDLMTYAKDIERSNKMKLLDLLNKMKDGHNVRLRKDGLFLCDTVVGSECLVHYFGHEVTKIDMFQTGGLLFIDIDLVEKED